MSDLALLGGRPAYEGDWPRWPHWDDRERGALQAALESGAWQSGPRVARLEAAFAAYQAASFGIGVTNGTATLEIALRALGVAAGDEVIVPSYTFAASALAVMTVGARPVFVDCDPDTLNLDTGAVRDAFGPATVGVMPVHVGGRPADMDAVGSLAADRGIFVLEDAAHAHGSEWRGRRVGALGALGSFSFQTGKLMTSGDGGMLVTNDERLAGTCRSLRSFGRDAAGEHLRLAGNERLTEFQAAILLCQLERLDAQIATRAAAVERLRGQVDGLPGIAFRPDDPRVTRESHYITLLHVGPEYAPGVPKATLLAALQAEGIPAEAGYGPLERQPVFREAIAKGGARKLPTPNSARAADERSLWLSFRLLLGGAAAADAIAATLHKLHAERASLARHARAQEVSDAGA